MLHTLLIGLGLYFTIAILMVPCRLLPVMLWPMYRVMEEYAKKPLLPMTLRRFFLDRIEPGMTLPLFFTATLYCAAGLITGIANVLTAVLARVWLAVRRK
jgi:hypothetical protein